MGEPVFTSHNCAVLSKLAVTTRVPSGLKLALWINPPCSSGAPMGWPVLASHTCAPDHAVTTRVPSGLKLALLTRDLCLSGAPMGWPVVASQIREVRSSLAVRTRVPSGLKLAL